MEKPVKNKEIAIEIGKLLSEHRCEDTIVLFVREICSWTDFFIITTVRSQTHIYGLLKYLYAFFKEKNIIQLNHKRNIGETGWVLLDCGDIVIHLMLKEQRTFYELERLWFKGTKLYPAE